MTAEITAKNAIKMLKNKSRRNTLLLLDKCPSKFTSATLKVTVSHKY